jgi:hypothetical protein
VHDLAIVMAFLVFFQYELSLNVIAGLLTITGYSVNDTIVVFDRVRENLRTMRRDNLAHIVNVAVNQTLARTVITAGTTILAVLALLLFGGEVLKGLRLHDAGRRHRGHLLHGLHRGRDGHSAAGAEALQGSDRGARCGRGPPRRAGPAGAGPPDGRTGGPAASFRSR